MSTYKIKSGDTLGAIAKRTGTSVAELARLNNITDVNKIRAGDSLITGAQEAFKPPPLVPVFTPPAAGDQDTKLPIGGMFYRPPSDPEAMADAGAGFGMLGDAFSTVVNAFGSGFGGGGRTSENMKGATTGRAPTNQVTANLLDFFNPFQGDKTEADYNEDALEGIRYAALNAYNQGRSNIDYGDYNLNESNVRAQAGMSGQRGRDSLIKRAILGDLSPTEQAAFSIGGGGVHVENGNLYATDIYDYGKVDPVAGQEQDLYSKVRNLLSYIPGNEYKTKINLGSLQSLGLPDNRLASVNNLPIFSGGG